MLSNQTKLKKSLNIIFRVLIIGMTWGYIIRQVFYHREWDDLLPAFSRMMDHSGWLISSGLVMILMLLNWSLESRKWQFMIGKIEKVSFFRSFQAVLTGVSISSFTPNRIGEYFGRVFILDRAGHIEGILITILGSMSQLMITLFAGSFAVVLFLPGYLAGFDEPIFYLYQGLIVVVVIFDLLLLLLYFNVPVLAGLRERLLKGKRMEKVRRFFEVLARFSFKDLGRVILLSLVRYGVFTVQYFLLLRIFRVPVPFTDGVMMISLIFLVLSVIPTIALTELGVRDSAALFLFGIYFSRDGGMSDEIRLGILAASTVLWMVNLAIPAVIGSFFVLRLKFFRKNTHPDPA